MGGRPVTAAFIDKDEDLHEKRIAVFDETRTFRYRLGRTWDPTVPPMVFIGLNPSTADSLVDDPTIRRCRSFARREGCGGLAMINLFAYRSTDPDKLRHVNDPIGPLNDDYLILVAHAGAPVVAAWGVHGTLRGRDRAVISMLTGYGSQLQCLGTTKDGHPRHPLYLAGKTPLEPYGGAR